MRVYPQSFCSFAQCIGDDRCPVCFGTEPLFEKRLDRPDETHPRTAALCLRSAPAAPVTTVHHETTARCSGSVRRIERGQHYDRSAVPRMNDVPAPGTQGEDATPGIPRIPPGSTPAPEQIRRLPE